MLRGTPEYVQCISKEALARLNWILFAFRQHHRWKPPKSCTDPGERRRKQWKEPGERKHHRPRGVGKCLLSEKKQDVNTLEGRIFCSWRSQYTLLSARVPWWRGPNWFNSLRNRSKLNGKLVSFYRQIQKFFATLIRYIDCKYFFNSGHSGTFILSKLRFHFFNWDCFHNIKLQVHLGRVPFDQNFRKFRFKIEWKRNFPEILFENFGSPLEVVLFFLESLKFRKFPVPFGISTRFEPAPVPLFV